MAAAWILEESKSESCARWCIIYLTEPHIHECVSGLTNFPHIQFSGPWCHQTRCHASWIRCVQTSQLVEIGNNVNREEQHSLWEVCHGTFKQLLKQKPESCNTFLANAKWHKLLQSFNLKSSNDFFSVKRLYLLKKLNFLNQHAVSPFSIHGRLPACTGQWSVPFKCILNANKVCVTSYCSNRCPVC